MTSPSGRPAALPYLDAAAVNAACSPAQAVAAIEDAIRRHRVDVDGPGRMAVPLAAGQFLLMPAELAAASDGPSAVGIKVATVAPGNAGSGVPRIQGLYLLFDATTLSPRAVLEGSALTTLRTPAVSVAAVLPRLRLDPTPLRLVIFGAGPQAIAHEATVRSALAGIRAVESVAYVVRDPQRAAEALGDSTLLLAGSPAAAEAVRQADLVVCATSAREPLFDSALVNHTATVIAVGSHEPAARELDAALFARSFVTVESVGSALAEAGDVIQAIDEGSIRAESLVPMSDVIDGSVRPPTDRPFVFKGVGMAWQDLVVAQVIARQGGSQPAE